MNFQSHPKMIQQRKVNFDISVVKKDVLGSRTSTHKMKKQSVNTTFSPLEKGPQSALQNR